MIYDDIKNLDTYRGIDPRVFRGLELLKNDYSDIPDGRYEVDGDKLFYMIQTYTTCPENDMPESHKKYVDIQYTLSGEERIGTGILDGSAELAESFPDRDLYLYRYRLDSLPMTPGKFMILWPQDAHAGAIANGQPTTVHKVVVKVHIN